MAGVGLFEGQAAEPAPATEVQMPGNVNPGDTYDDGNVVDPNAVPGGDAAAPQATPAQQVAELATNYGFDPREFEGLDPTTAQATIRYLVNRQANEGYNYQQQLYAQQSQQQTQQVPSPPAAPQLAAGSTPQNPSSGIQPLDLKALGLGDDDPAAKAFRQLEATLGKTFAEVQSLTAKQQQVEYNQQVQAQQERAQQVEAATDALASPLYGTSQNRTIVQRINVDRLHRIATNIVYADKAAGKPTPTPAVALRRAAMIDQQEQNGTQVIGQKPATAPAAAPFVQQNQYSQPTRQVGPPPAPKGLSLTDKWTNNPDFRRQHGLGPLD